MPAPLPADVDGVDGTVAVEDEVEAAGGVDCAHAAMAQLTATTESSLAAVFMNGCFKSWRRHAAA
jgi:hypothetical protein